MIEIHNMEELIGFAFVIGIAYVITTAINRAKGW